MKSRIALALGAGLVAATLSAVPLGSAQAAPATTTDGCLKSVPEPGSTEKVQICYTLFRPAGASRTDRVPFIMHSHGWGGSRTKDPARFQKWLDAGYGVLSFDQRGFGESGGKAHVENPDYEGHDVRRLISLIADLGWVRKDGPGDPRMGAIGGSYGGGYQFLGAFESLRLRGTPVFDALAPEITWYDLKESLGPEEVVRTEWALALSAAGAANDALETTVYKALVEGAATGDLAGRLDPRHREPRCLLREERPQVARRARPPARHPGPARPGHHRHPVPAAAGHRQLQARRSPPRARAESIFVGYNGGHTLPAIYPRGVEVTSDPCSEQLAGGSFEDLALRFMNEKLKGRATGLRGYGDYHLATPDSTCTTVGSVAPNTDLRHRPGRHHRGRRTRDRLPDRRGPDQHRRLAAPDRDDDRAGRQQPGVLRPRRRYVARGRPPGAEQRAADQRAGPGRTASRAGSRCRRWPSTSRPGQTLYVIASPVSETFGGMSSRTPGAVVLDDTVAHLPVVSR